MSRILMAASLAALLAACTASTDDVGAVGEDNSPALVEGDFVCPDNLVFSLDDYEDETLPSASDFSVWHAENALRDGVMETDSGLQYRVLQPGLENGATPRAGEEIFANYHGFFPNGDVFDSSYQAGEPIVHTADGFIAGWNEALADMKVCETRTLYVPANLAYGENPVGRPGGTLVFHMQLLRVNRTD